MSDPSLKGRAVVVTRPEVEGGALASALAARGATPIHRPVLEIRTEGASAELAEALAELPDTDWLILTSPRAVGALDEAGAFDDPPPPRLRIAVVGSRTGDAVRRAGWPVHLEPGEAGAASLLLELERKGVDRRSRVLFPASARARTLLPDGLAARGARVRVVQVYEPVARSLDPAEWSSGATDWSALTFTSPSAVEALAHGLPDETLAPLRRLPAGVQGPTTGAAAREAGWAEVVEARPRTFAGLAESLARHLGPDDPDAP